MPSLRTFLDLDDLSCYQAMGLAVDGFSGFFARSLDEAKNRAASLIEPVLQVICAVLPLNFQVLRMCTRDCPWRRRRCTR